MLYPVLHVEHFLIYGQNINGGCLEETTNANI